MQNNYVMHLSSKKLMEKLQFQLEAGSAKKIAEYMQENLGDVHLTGGVKDGMIQSQLIMLTNNKHNNSLEFIFNMIDAVNNIMETEKQEARKKKS